MNRYRAYYPMDEAPSKAGDTFFVGLDNRRAPAQLEEGLVSVATNVRMRYGRVQPRGGSMILKWMKTHGNRLGSRAWQEIYGCGRFYDPETGVEHWLIAADGGVWDALANQPATQLLLAPGTVLNAETFSGFVQCFNGVLLLLGEGAAPLYLSSLVSGFEALAGTFQGINGPAFTGASDNTATVYPLVTSLPACRQGCYMGNRFWGVHGADTVVYSDLFDPTAYFVLAQLRINEGNGDRLVAVYPYDRNTLLCFKEHSVLRLENCTGDLSGVTLVPMTSKYGCVSPTSIVDIGTDTFWMSERGVTSLRQTQQNELQGTSVTLSEPIEATMQRINWQARAGICGETWNNFLYFAVPLDGSPTNNAVLVFDLLNQKWASVDEGGPGTALRQFQKLRVQGRERLCAVGMDGTLRLLEEGGHDQTYRFVLGEHGGPLHTAVAIPTRVVTRGYLANEADRKRWKQAKLQVATTNPTYSVRTITEGAFETCAYVTNQTRVRGRHTQRDTVDWDPTATTGPESVHATPFREDYSLLVTSTGFQLNDGAHPDQLQTFTHGLPIGERGHALQIDLTNTTGRLELLSIECAGTEDERRLAARV